MQIDRSSTAWRTARRMARAARWDRPLTTTRRRLAAWLNMLLVDHGIFRIAYLNLHKVTEAFWRSAQPAPNQIAALAAQGIRTIVTLRGGREFGSWPLEKEACEAHGIVLVEFLARSREAPSAETVREAKALFDSLAYPALIHCKSGADRAGLVAALYLILREGRGADEALRQLSPRYGHWRWSKTGILDAFLIAYRDQGEAKGRSLIDWVEQDYDPETLRQSFRTHAWSNFVVERILRRE